MQIGGQGAHGHYLAGLGAGQAGQAGGHAFVVGLPRVFGGKVPLHAQALPVVQFRLQGRGRGLGLQTQRITGQVDAIFARVLGDEKLRPVGKQGVRSVAQARFSER